jgi:hypothetical protein
MDLVHFSFANLFPDMEAIPLASKLLRCGSIRFCTKIYLKFLVFTNLEYDDRHLRARIITVTK